MNLAIYDVTGRLVRTLVRGAAGPGIHQTVWDGRTEGGASAGSGVYSVRLDAPDFSGVRRLTLVR